MSKIGTHGLDKMFLGRSAIRKAYLGSNLVYNATQELPLPNDAEIEYLQSSGTQYIILGNDK